MQIKPLSVNDAFRGRHYKTKECKDFETDLWFLLPKGHVAGEVDVWIDFILVNASRTDVSNLVKIMEDVIVKKGLIEDDRKIWRLYLSKERGKVDSITVRILPRLPGGKR